MLPFNSTPSPEAMAYAAALTEEEKTYQRDIARARAYHAGAQFVKLTPRLREFLGDSTTYADYDMLRLNVCKTVVAAVTERLVVKGFDSTETGAPVALAMPAQKPVQADEGQDAPEVAAMAPVAVEKPLASLAMQWWKHNRMAVFQDDIHEPTIRDATSYVIVDWDDNDGMPVFYPNPRFVSSDVGGDDYGCKMFYQNDDPRQSPLYATKQWQEVYYIGKERRTRKRVTYYYPDRIEKYESRNGDLARIVDDPLEAWPVWWTDTLQEGGRPLGIAVVPFHNAGGTDGAGGIEAWEAIPLQNAINKEFVDLMTAADTDAFKILIALGFEPRDRDNNPLAIGPGKWVGTTKSPGDASVSSIPASDLSGFLNVIDSLILKVAQVTDTPASRFVTTRQIASEGTLQQQEGPLVKKVQKRQARIGDSWEQVMRLSVRLSNAYAATGLDEVVGFTCLWESAATRDESAELSRAAQKQTLGIPFRQVIIELGYSPEQADEWQANKDAKAAADLAKQEVMMAGRTGSELLPSGRR